MKHRCLRIYFLTIFALICCIPTISAGALVKSGDLYYIIDLSTQTARVTDSQKSYNGSYVSGDLIIPQNVYYDSMTFSVTTIDNYAFKDCKGLTSVTIPSSVTTIGSDAFSDCTGLTSLVSLSTIPPACGDNTFYGINKSECMLYVPKESIDDYRQAEQWKEFCYFKEVSSTGVDNIAIDGAEVEIKITADGIKIDNVDQKPVEIYTIDGKILKHYSAYQGEVIDLEHGFYIIRVGNISKKIKF